MSQVRTRPRCRSSTWVRRPMTPPATCGRWETPRLPAPAGGLLDLADHPVRPVLDCQLKRLESTDVAVVLQSLGTCPADSAQEPQRGITGLGHGNVHGTRVMSAGAAPCRDLRDFAGRRGGQDAIPRCLARTCHQNRWASLAESEARAAHPFRRPGNVRTRSRAVGGLEGCTQGVSPLDLTRNVIANARHHGAAGRRARTCRRNPPRHTLRREESRASDRGSSRRPD